MTANTTRMAIPYPQLTDPNTYPTHMQNLATALDSICAVYLEGTFASRPAAATHGRIYFATDTSNAYYDNGLSWTQLNLNAASVVTTKGDLLVASGAGALARLGVGTDGQSLTALAAATNGVQWQSILGMPLALSGAGSATRFVGGTTSGAPVTGTFALGDYVIGQDGSISICTTAGSPGTWRTLPLSSAPKGVIGRLRRTTATSGTTATTPSTAQKVMELDVSLTSGRLYRVGAIDVPLGSSASGFGELQLTYTTDGSTPAVSSTLLVSSGLPTTSTYAAANCVSLYVPGSNLTFKVLLSCYGGTAGTYFVGGASTWPVDLICEDLGIDPGSSGTIF